MAHEECTSLGYFVGLAALNIFATIMLGATGMVIVNSAKAAMSDPHAFSDTRYSMEAFAIAGSLSYVPMVIAWFAEKKLFKTQNNLYLSRALSFLFLNTMATTAGCALASKPEESENKNTGFKPVLYFLIPAMTSLSAYFLYLQKRQIENSHAPYGNEDQEPQPNAEIPQPGFTLQIPIPGLPGI